jgi:hypothetical protein
MMMIKATLITSSAIIGLSTIASLAFGLWTMSANAEDTKKVTVEAEPQLRVPSVDYRKDWVNLGTYSVLADKPAEGAKQMHVVYTDRKNVDAYLATGQFPDGAVLVKDVFAAKTENLTTGTASYPGQLAGRFVMVKDSSGKLGPSPRVGDGWGWAFYEGPETTRTVTTNYKTDCLGCHEPVRKTDLVYVQGYTVLRK